MRVNLRTVGGMLALPGWLRPSGERYISRWWMLPILLLMLLGSSARAVNQGACCIGRYHCVIAATSTVCTSTYGGTFEGSGTTCNAFRCDSTTSACCLWQWRCLTVTQDSCQTLGGTWFAGDTNIGGDSTVVCYSTFCDARLGACCYAPDSCKVISADSCATTSGTFLGWGFPCDNGVCGYPKGACCYTDSLCTVCTEAHCDSINGDYKGDGMPCSSYACYPYRHMKGSGGPTTVTNPSISLLPGARDTLGPWEVWQCDKMKLIGIYQGDTVRYWLDFGLSATGPWTIVDSTNVFSSKAARTWNINRQLVHDAASGSNHGPTFGDWMERFLRVRMYKYDKADTLKQIDVHVECK
jgi:hypothetical protein